jgi:endoglucanase
MLTVGHWSGVVRCALCRRSGFEMGAGISMIADRMTAALRLVWAGLALAAIICVWSAPVAAKDANAFHRGVSIHDAMNWATMDVAKKTYVYPPFSDAAHPLTAPELTAIRKVGFDFVRLTIDPGPFLQFQGAQLDGTYDVLRQRVQMILGAGLGVIVDFHPVKQDLDYGPDAITKSTDTPLFNAYCAMLSRTARLLNGLRANRVALELMNEPPVGGTPDTDARYQMMAERLYQAARSGSQQLTLVVSGGQGGGPEGLIALDPQPFAADNAVLFTFHYYEPGEFTHQTVASVPAYRVAADIPYPATARPMSDSANAIKARVDALDTSPAQRSTDLARGLAELERYRAQNFNGATIANDFQKVADWARANGVPAPRVFLGEFDAIRTYGNYHGARTSERAQWLHDVRQSAERSGFIWSVWAYRGYGGMAIVTNDSTTDIDPVTRSALGLQ